MRIKLITSFLLLLTLLSCDKEKEAGPMPQPEPEVPTPQPDPQVKAVPFSFRLDPQPEGTEDFELIVSQKDGEVLLDTLIAARTEHGLTVKSADTKFDVTTIYSDPATSKYSMRTYVQVNPDNWHIDERISRTVWGEKEQATIYYTNVPGSLDNLQFTGKQSAGAGYSYSGGNLRLNYDRLLPTDLAYLLLPESGKYIFTEVTSPETHVDFSNANTAVKRKYNKPAGVSKFVSILYGYTEAGDYSKTMILTLANSSPDLDYDLQYPTTVIKEFQLNLSYTDAEGYRHSYFNSGPTVPTEMPFIPKSDFTVTKSEANDFQITFGEDKPTTYTMLWESGDLNANWRIFSSPEETSFKPKEFLENLSTVSLEGKSVSGFTIKSLFSYKAEGYTHQSMNDYNNNPEAYLRKELRESREIRKGF